MRIGYVVGLMAAGVGWCCPREVEAQPCAANNRFGNCTLSPAASNCGCDWFDDMESYTAGQPMPGTVASPVNGWEEWRGSALGVRGDITTERNHTPGGTKSLRIDPNDDQVRVMQGGLGGPGSNGGTLGDGVGYDEEVSPAWSFQAWNFVPTGQNGDQFLIMLSDYDGGSNTAWNVQVSYNAATGLVQDQHITNLTLPIVTNQWVLTDVFINLQDDVVLVFYNDVFFYSGIWSTGDEANTPGNDPILHKYFGGIDLFSNAGASPIFWDDISTTAAEIPSVLAPTINCISIARNDATGCCDFQWTIRNENLDDPFSEFLVDIEAGTGGDLGGTCVGLTDPPGWTCTNCTGWSGGHAMYRCLSDAPANDLDPGESVSGLLSVKVNGFTDKLSASGLTIPPLSVTLHAAQGPQFGQVCALADYTFGPTGLGEWSPRKNCICYLNAPALAVWAKAMLGMVLVGGGALLVVRTRRAVPV